MAKKYTTLDEFLTAKTLVDTAVYSNPLHVGLMLAILSANEGQQKILKKAFPGIFNETILRRNAPDGRLISELTDG